MKREGKRRGGKDGKGRGPPQRLVYISHVRNPENTLVLVAAEIKTRVFNMF